MAKHSKSKAAIAKTPLAKTPLVNESIVKEPEIKEPVVKAEEKKETVKDVVKDTVKETAQKVVKKATTKSAAKTKKAAPVKEEPVVYLQFGENEVKTDDILEKVKAIYVSEGHRVSSIKSLQIYMKPEEYKAYYVINKKITGSVDLF